jgi:hypothetical protein
VGASDSSCLIRQGAVDEHEIGRRPLFEDLSGGGHAEEQAAAGDEELLGQQHGKRSAHRAADDAEGFSRMLELVEFSVVARPAIAPPDPSGFDERAQNIAVRIEQADLRNRGKWHILLPPRFAQQILGSNTDGAEKSFPARIGGSSGRENPRYSCSGAASLPCAPPSSAQQLGNA